MIKRTVPELQNETVAVAAKPKHQAEYVEIRIPRISFRNTNINTYLVFMLIIFAFLLGMLTNKVIFLEKVSKTNAAAAAVPSVAAQPINQAAAAAVPTPPDYASMDVGKLPVLGDQNAKVTVVEFSDFQCPFCEQYFTNTASQLNDTYIKTGKVKFAYRHFPLFSIHPNSEKASEASECANEQDKFWDFHDLLFKNQTTWSAQAATDAADSFTSYAGQLGLDTTQFRSCLDSSKFKANVTADANAGNKALVDGTPTFFINGHRIVGAVPFNDLQIAIEAELKK